MAALACTPFLTWIRVKRKRSAAATFRPSGLRILSHREFGASAELITLAIGVGPRPGERPAARRASKAALLPELLVFVEGLRTEEIYLTYWRRQYRDRVRVEIDDYRGGPLQLVERAVEAQRIEARDARKGRGRAHDQIWCMFDRDERPNFAQAIDLAEKHGINLSISNPCLELWFILHFEDRASYLERYEAQRRTEELLGSSKVLTDQRSPRSRWLRRSATTSGKARREACRRRLTTEEQPQRWGMAYH